jgi:hypothetical protein
MVKKKKRKLSQLIKSNLAQKQILKVIIRKVIGKEKTALKKYLYTVYKIQTKH